MMQEFVQQTKDMVTEGLHNVHTVLPGRIVSVDTADGTATVIPVMKFKTENGDMVDYPQINDIPIVFPQGASQGTSIVYPIRKGDGCLILIAEQSLDYWMYGMETDTDLRFDITNAICIPGLFQKAPNTLAEANRTGDVIVAAGGTRLKVGSGGVNITGSLTVSGSISAVSVSAGGVSLAGHTHTSSDPGSQTSGPA